MDMFNAGLWTGLFFGLLVAIPLLAWIMRAEAPSSEPDYETGDPE